MNDVFILDMSHCWGHLFIFLLIRWDIPKFFLIPVYFYFYLWVILIGSSKKKLKLYILLNIDFCITQGDAYVG
jgi:hypothetical protein